MVAANIIGLDRFADQGRGQDAVEVGRVDRVAHLAAAGLEVRVDVLVLRHPARAVVEECRGCEIDVLHNGAGGSLPDDPAASQVGQHQPDPVDLGPGLDLARLVKASEAADQHERLLVDARPRELPHLELRVLVPDQVDDLRLHRPGGGRLEAGDAVDQGIDHQGASPRGTGCRLGQLDAREQRVRRLPDRLIEGQHGDRRGAGQGRRGWPREYGAAAQRHE